MSMSGHFTLKHNQMVFVYCVGLSRKYQYWIGKFADIEN